MLWDALYMKFWEKKTKTEEKIEKKSKNQALKVKICEIKSLKWIRFYYNVLHLKTDPIPQDNLKLKPT